MRWGGVTMGWGLGSDGATALMGFGWGLGSDGATALMGFGEGSGEG